jgi:hypothetical protein
VKLFYYAKRMGLKDHASLFQKDFLVQINHMSTTEEKYEFANFLKGTPGQLETLNEEILEQLMSAKIARKLGKLSRR